MMRRIGLGWICPPAAIFAVLATALTAPAQTPPGSATAAPDESRMRVPITTIDGVELDGTYFRSSKPGRDASCVMMVHKFGENRSKADWILLAAKLQAEGFAVLTFDLRGHGGSTQLSNPDTFWSLPFNRNGIIGGNSTTQKTTISFTDFKPSYLPYMVNDLAAARRIFEQKNDAGEVNVHSLIIVGAQEGADLGFLFTAAEYMRIYRVGVTALQSNGTPYNAGADIAAGIWLSLAMRPAAPPGAPNFPLSSWIRPVTRPALRDKTPMCFIYGDKEPHARADSESVFRALTAPIGGRMEKHKFDDLHPIRGTDLAGPALLGQQSLDVSTYVVNYCKRVMADRRAIPWTEVKPDVNVLQLVPVGQFMR